VVIRARPYHPLGAPSALTLRQMVEDLLKPGATITQSKGIPDGCRFTAWEHIMGNMFMTYASDIWSLAMTALQVRASVLRVDPCLMYLLQLLTGERPFAEVTSNSVVVIEVREPGRMFIPARLKRALVVL
jgi:hypothetical protein